MRHPKREGYVGLSWRTLVLLALELVVGLVAAYGIVLWASL